MKVKCSTCDNESNGKCSVKNTTVKVNKNRKCNDYILDPTKVKYKQTLPSRPAVGDENFKQKPKGVKGSRVRMAKQKVEERNQQHPITGDLSRFKSSATRTD